MSAEQPNPTRPDVAAPPADSRTRPPAAEAETLPGHLAGAAAADLPPELLDHPRYQVTALLGRGGMGAVYKAVHRVMERPVALKVMRPDLVGNQQAVDRFHREVKAAAQLVHPNIVTAFDAEQIGQVHFLVMEFVPGKTLAEVVAADGPLPAARAVSYIRQAARGLQFAFDKGMIHRDIKPHNLMLTDGGGSVNLEERTHGQVKVLDFGLARFASDEAGSGAQTASGVIMGTVDFMAPEQADSARKADVRSDIYSLGCTLYYLLAGRAVFPEGTIIQRVMAHVEKTPPPLSRADLPPGLHRVLAKMLAKDPNDRYQTPAAVAEALAAFLHPLADAMPVVDVLEVLPGDPLPAPTAPVMARPRSKPTPAAAAPAPRRGGRFLLGCFLLGLVAVLGTIGGGVYLIHELMNRGERFANKVMSEMKQQSDAWDDLERTIVPPPEAGPEWELFPKRLGDFVLMKTDTQAAYEPLDLTLVGRHAEYKAGPRELHVSVHKATNLEREAVFRRALDRLNPKAKGTPGMMHTPGATTHATDTRLTYHRHDTGDRGAMWWNRDWLYLARTGADADPTPLLQQFLKERSAAGWK